MDKKEFIRKWAQLFWVTGLREMFGDPKAGAIPPDHASIREEYERMVVAPMDKLEVTTDTSSIYQALATSYEFVYLFPYIMATSSDELVLKYAARAIKGEPIFTVKFPTMLAVLEGATGTCEVPAYDGVSLMEFPRCMRITYMENKGSELPERIRNVVDHVLPSSIVGSYRVVRAVQYLKDYTGLTEEEHAWALSQGYITVEG